MTLSDKIQQLSYADISCIKEDLRVLDIMNENLIENGKDVPTAEKVRQLYDILANENKSRMTELIKLA